MAASDKLDQLERDLREVSEKLAKCRREQCEKDHDSIIKLEGEQNTLKRDLAKMSNDINEQTTEIDASYTKMNQLAGNINQLTDKIADIVKSDTARKRFVYTIIAGILISVLSAFIIWMTANTVNSMLKMNNDDINKLQQTIESVQREINDTRNVNEKPSKNIDR